MSLWFRLIKNPIYFIYKLFIGPFVTIKYIKKLETGYDECLLSDRLLNILEYAVINVPRYKNLKIDYSLSAEENLNAFPLLKRIDLQTNKYLGLSKAYVPSIEANTSGSSGDPLYFFRTALAGAVDTAHQKYSLKNMGYIKGDRVICFNGFEPSAKMLTNNIFWKRKALIGEGGFGSIQFSTNKLTKENFEYYLQEIMIIRPAIIKGYPSSIYAFFRLLGDRVLDFRIKAIHLTSENIYDYQVEFIERKAKAKVYKQYGHTECAMFAEADGGSDIYKFSPLYGYLEVLNDDGTQVENGQVGQITVTGFNCYKESFIRYQTGDFARYIGFVDGMQAVDMMMGREQDYFISFDGNSIPITSIISGSHLTINKYVTRWQIRQLEIGNLNILLVEDELVPNTCLAEIKDLFAPYANIDFIKVTNIELSKSGKYKFFVSEV
jgi:phenylacetate-CoA ligase